MAGKTVAATGRGIDRQPARQDRRRRADRLAEALRSVIAEAIEAGGSSLRDHIQTDGSLGYFQHRFKVYDREGEPCPRRECSGAIARIVQSRPLDLLLPGLPAMS